MKKITLNDGFQLEVEENRLDNMELVEAMSDLVEGENALAIARVVRALLGDKTKKALYAHFKTDDGRVPTEKVGNAITEIMQALGQAGKN